MTIKQLQTSLNITLSWVAWSSCSMQEYNVHFVNITLLIRFFPRARSLECEAGASHIPEGEHIPARAGLTRVWRVQYAHCTL